jgi:hypothetical protein
MLCDTTLSEVLDFKLLLTETAAGTVAMSAIVITLDITEYRFPHYFTASKAFSMEAFDLQ